MTSKIKIITFFILLTFAVLGYLKWSQLSGEGEVEELVTMESTMQTNVEIQGFSTTNVETSERMKIETQETKTSVGSALQDANKNAHDPILDELEIKTGNELINYIYNEQGQLQTEVDLDQNSLSYKKPLRKYSYTNDNITSLTKYQYYVDQVVETKIDVAYKADGTVLDSKKTVNTFKNDNNK